MKLPIFLSKLEEEHFIENCSLRSYYAASVGRNTSVLPAVTRQIPLVLNVSLVTVWNVCVFQPVTLNVRPIFTVNPMIYCFQNT